MIIDRGRLVLESSLADLTVRSAASVRVRSPQADELRAQLAAEGISVSVGGDGELAVAGVTSERVGEIAAAGGIVLHELTPRESTLEEVFLELTGAGAP